MQKFKLQEAKTDISQTLQLQSFGQSPSDVVFIYTNGGNEHTP